MFGPFIFYDNEGRGQGLAMANKFFNIACRRLKNSTTSSVEGIKVTGGNPLQEVSLENIV